MKKKITAVPLFLKYAKTYKYRFFISLALMPITAWLAVKGPALIQDAIDNGIKNLDTEYVLRISYFYLIVLVASSVQQAFQNILLQKSGIRTIRDLRKGVVHHICHIGKKDYDSKPLGVHLSRATSDVESIGETFLQGITYILSDSLKIIAVFIYIFTENITLGLITLILLPIIIFTINWFRIKLRVLYDNIRTLNGKLSAQLNEAFSMLYEIYNFNLQKAHVNDFQKNNDEYRTESVKAISLDALVYSLLDGMFIVSIGTILLILSLTPSITETIPIGLLVAYIALLQQLFEPVKEMGARFAVLQSALAALNKISNTLNTELPEDTGTRCISKHDITIKDLSFAYKEDETVLKELNLTIPKGNSLAVVGPTGSGKSTLVRLLTRQFDIKKGEIYFGDDSIKDLTRETLKENIVMVPQDPAIFHESIKFNITLDRPDVTDERMEDICKKINIHDFIQQMEHGYDSPLEEGGSNLSTGQRQLIALARALASSAEILIFDEATANIDTETEQLIQNAMDFAMTQKTSILIAHRLSTIKHVDNIIVLQSGNIAESGSHEELIQQDGIYKKMYDLQKTES
ncbi:MAG: ABC transporter ATP-binding protein/permease [Lentisphaeraceae bacterium]|nr:ABC transporter ATP-binding protein/permease [Lentisphaeraceae bacterium]